MHVLDTERLRLRTAEPEDAPFYLELVNTPGFYAYIGDRGIRSLTAARDAIVSGPMAMQRERGHSIYVVTTLAGATPIGMAGLIKREVLDDVDLGYAFLPRYGGQGYAFEAAFALVEHARADLGLTRLVAITSADNAGSKKLLDKLGMHFEKVIYTAPDDPGTLLYAMPL